MTCTRCRSREVHAQDLCMTCYQYERRNGEPRSWTLITKAGERVLERKELGRLR